MKTLSTLVMLAISVNIYANSYSKVDEDQRQSTDTLVGILGASSYLASTAMDSRLRSEAAGNFLTNPELIKTANEADTKMLQYSIKHLMKQKGEIEELQNKIAKESISHSNTNLSEQKKQLKQMRIDLIHLKVKHERKIKQITTQLEKQLKARNLDHDVYRRLKGKITGFKKFSVLVTILALGDIVEQLVQKDLAQGKVTKETAVSMYERGYDKIVDIVSEDLMPEIVGAINE